MDFLEKAGLLKGIVVDHGGSLGRARALFPHAPAPFVDLSTMINPHSYPLFDLPATAGDLEGTRS